MLRPRLWSPMILAMTAFGLAPSPAHAGLLQISVTNDEPAGGFTLAPVWFGLHGGTFSPINVGGTASSALQSVAELGNTGPMTTLFSGMGPQTTLASGGAIPQFTPGMTNSTFLNVASPATNRYLDFAAMFVPSNDLFIGNSNPLAYALYDAAGNFNGPLTIQVYGRDVWDAGTEVDDITFGAAFVVGEDATQGNRANSTIHPFFGGANANAYLASINGVATPNGPITHLFNPNELIATIQINSVPEPSSLLMAGIGLSGLLLGAARRGYRPSRG